MKSELGCARRSGEENVALLSSIYACREGFISLILYSSIDDSTAVTCDCHDYTGREFGASHAPVIPRNNVTGKFVTVRLGSYSSDNIGGSTINTN